MADDQDNLDEAQLVQLVPESEQDESQKDKPYQDESLQDDSQQDESGGWVPVRRRRRCKFGLNSRPLNPLWSARFLNLDNDSVDTRWAYTLATFRHSELNAKLRQKLEIAMSHEHSYDIKEAVCLGIGSFSNGENAAYLQLVAFVYMVDILKKIVGHDIPCIFQEPRFTQTDKEFFERIDTSYTVMESPEAFRSITCRSFVFGIHLYGDLLVQALNQARLPALIVSSEFREYIDTYSLRLFASRDDVQRSRDLQVVRDLTAIQGRYNKISLVADLKHHSDIAFDGTMIYYRTKSQL